MGRNVVKTRSNHHEMRANHPTVPEGHKHRVICDTTVKESHGTPAEPGRAPQIRLKRSLQRPLRTF